MRVSTQRTTSRTAFTLVEVAVSLVIIGIGLTLCLQSLQMAKQQAAQTRNLKLARELGVMTLGQIEAGLFQEEIDSSYSETYAQEGYPDFFFEVLLGDEDFEDQGYDEDQDGFHDAFEARRQRREDEADDSDEEDVAEPYEMVKIRVSFPRIHQYKNYLDMESWMVWEQVYGKEEEDEASSNSPSPTAP